MEIYRQKNVKRFDFAAGATANSVNRDTDPSGFVSLQGVSHCCLIMPADFNTDTRTLTSSVPGDTGFTVTGATGRVNLTSDQALAFAAMKDCKITTDVATAGAVVIYMSCMDG